MQETLYRVGNNTVYREHPEPTVVIKAECSVLIRLASSVRANKPFSFEVHQNQDTTCMYLPVSIKTFIILTDASPSRPLRQEAA